MEAHEALLTGRNGADDESIRSNHAVHGAKDYPVRSGRDYGISCRQMRRWKDRWEEHGYEGLFDRRRGTPSPKRVPVATVQEVVHLYQEQYSDFNVKHFQREVATRASEQPKYTWVKTALRFDPLGSINLSSTYSNNRRGLLSCGQGNLSCKLSNRLQLVFAFSPRTRSLGPGISHPSP